MIDQVVSLLCSEFNIEDKNRVLDIVSGKAFREYMTLADIAAVIAEEFGITIDELRSKRRYAHFVDARVRFSRVARNEYGYRLIKIADYLGCDHTTVVHHVLHRKDYMPKYEGIRVKKEGFPVKEETPVVRFERPKAEYTNIQTGYL